MFFVLSKILDVLLSPLAWGMALVLVGLVRRRASPPVWQRLAPFVGLGVLYVFSIGPISDALEAFCEAGAPNTYDPNKHYDTVIVLGGLVDGSRKTPEEPVSYNDNVERLLAAYAILRKGQADTVLLSSGTWGRMGTDPPEAVLLGHQLERWGIDEKRILVEDQSKNTRENARFSARIVHDHQFKSVLVVTSAFHMKRAAACFAAVDLPVDTLPVDYRSHDRTFVLRSLLPETDALAMSSAVLHELAGRLVYRVVGYGR